MPGLKLSVFPFIPEVAPICAGFVTGNIESKVRSWREVRTLCCDEIFFFASFAANIGSIIDTKLNLTIAYWLTLQRMTPRLPHPSLVPFLFVFWRVDYRDLQYPLSEESNDRETQFGKWHVLTSLPGIQSFWNDSAQQEPAATRLKVSQLWHLHSENELRA